MCWFSCDIFLSCSVFCHKLCHKKCNILWYHEIPLYLPKNFRTIAFSCFSLFIYIVKFTLITSLVLYTVTYSSSHVFDYFWNLWCRKWCKTSECDYLRWYIFCNGDPSATNNDQYNEKTHLHILTKRKAQGVEHHNTTKNMKYTLLILYVFLHNMSFYCFE